MVVVKGKGNFKEGENAESRPDPVTHNEMSHCHMGGGARIACTIQIHPPRAPSPGGIDFDPIITVVVSFNFSQARPSSPHPKTTKHTLSGAPSPPQPSKMSPARGDNSDIV